MACYGDVTIWKEVFMAYFEFYAGIGPEKTTESLNQETLCLAREFNRVPPEC
jgi:hypothetical protein